MAVLDRLLLLDYQMRYGLADALGREIRSVNGEEKDNLRRR
jgi:hypothetical protein